MDEQKTALAVEEREVDSPVIQQPSPARFGKTTAKRRFLGVSFWIYLGILVALALAALLYVYHVLSWYESSQPENVAHTYVQKLQKAAKKGELDSVVSLDGLSADADSLTGYMACLADGTVSCLASESDAASADLLTFDALCNGYRMGEVKLTYTGQQTKLGIFTADLWEVSSCAVTPYRFEAELPVTLKVTENGAAVNGTLSEDGKTVKYAISSLTLPGLMVTDLFGNTEPYSARTFDVYEVSVPSNYTVKNGGEVVPLSAAVLADIEAYQYLYEYNEDIPRQATYLLCALSGDLDVSVQDNLGSLVDISAMQDGVLIENQATVSTMPAIIQSAPDPLEAAKLWNLFMTRDLTGERYGFYQLAEYLIRDSYLRNVAWKWATGVDITFTSSHRLHNPPFQVAEVSNFVAYGDKAFSCDILLEKELLLTRTGAVVPDKMHSTFYFVYVDDSDNGKDDPHWAIADKRDIAVTE